MSGNLQLLSKIAFSGPYTRNHGNHFSPGLVYSQFDACPEGGLGAALPRLQPRVSAAYPVVPAPTCPSKYQQAGSRHQSLPVGEIASLSILQRGSILRPAGSDASGLRAKPTDFTFRRMCRCASSGPKWCRRGSRRLRRMCYGPTLFDCARRFALPGAALRGSADRARSALHSS